MKDPSKAKVMFEIDEKPLIHYVLDLAYEMGSQRVVAIIGYQRESVEAYLRRSHPKTEFAVQAEQLGTGHAVMQTEPLLKGTTGDVVVLSGDVPLLTLQTMKTLADHHHRTNAVATILTAEFDDPTGYGRIIRNQDTSVERIVEHKDATDAERAIREINSGIYVFDGEALFEALGHITPHNVQKEYYLTDVFSYFRSRGWNVQAVKTVQIDEIHGINTVEQLEHAAAIMAARRNS